MPTYEVVLNDGRKLHIEADTPPTEEEVTQYLYPKPNEQMATSEQFAPKPDQSKLSANAPSTVGFIKNLATDAVGMGKGALDTLGKRSMAQDFTNPKDPMTPGKMVDFVSSRAKADTDPEQIYQHPAQFLTDAAVVADAAPSVGRGIKAGVKWAAEPGPIKAMARGAAENTPLIGKPIKGAIRGLNKYRAGQAARVPTPMAEGFDQFMPNKGGPVSPDAGVTTGPKIPYGPSDSSPMAAGYDQYGSGGGGVEDILQGHLMEEMGQKPTMGAPPPPTEAGPSTIFDDSGRPLGDQTYANGRSADTVDEVGQARAQSEQISGNKHPMVGTGMPGATFKYSDPMSGEKFFDVPTETGPSTISHTEALKRGYEIPAVDESVDPVAEMQKVRAARDAAQARQQSIPDEAPAPAAAPTAPDMFSQETPWHSGAESGSPDALAASKLHQNDAEMDAIYKALLADPRK